MQVAEGANGAKLNTQWCWSIRCQETVVPSPADDITLTYVCVWTLVGAGAGEGDEFMAPFVDHETADCGEKEGERG